MAPPSIVSKRVRAIHAALIEAGWAGKKLPKEELERYLAKELGMSLPSIRMHVDQGRVLGLWDLIDQRPKPGALLVHPPEVPEVRDGMRVINA